MKRLVVLGGGTAGTMVANKLRAGLGKHELHITVVDRDDAHHYQPGYLFMPFGIYNTTDIVRSRHRFLDDGVDLVLTEIDHVDPDHKAVHLADGRTLGYDYLVVATGVSPRPDATPGMQGPLWREKVHEFYSLPGAQALTEAMRRFRGGRLVVHITEMPIKCPVAPMEFTFLADDWLRSHGIREKTDVTYVTPLDGAFTKPVASRELATALVDRQIALETDFAVEHIDNDASEFVSFDGRRIGFDLLVTVPLNMGADWVARSGMGDELNLVPCDQHTMASLNHPDVWVLGDAGTLQTSKAGSVAHFAADVFTHNFIEEFNGRPATHGFDGHANCFIESGNRKGMLLDFNYSTEPFTGTFPLPVAGPFRLLKETRLNHLGKLAFRWIYWNMLLPGRPIPMIPTAMSMAGKRVESDVSAAATGLPSVEPPSSPAPAPRVVPRTPATVLDRERSGSPTTAPEDLREPSGRSVTKGRAPAPRLATTPLATTPPATPAAAPDEAWDEREGAQRAHELGIEMTDAHWGPIRFLRADYPARGETATLRRTSTVGGFPIQDLFELFPGKPAKNMAYIAGLPKPKGCV